MPSILHLHSATQQIKRHITSRSILVYEMFQISSMKTKMKMDVNNE